MTKSANQLNHRKNFLRGASQVMVLMPRREYIIPKKGEGPAQDARAMRGDFARVGQDLRETMKKYGER